MRTHTDGSVETRRQVVTGAVDFFRGKTADDGWGVISLGLHIQDSVNNVAAVNRAASRDRPRDTADMRVALPGGPAGREALFEAAISSVDFEGNLRGGRRAVSDLIEMFSDIDK